jgi:heparan-alpha-glucosaminide N-acetyltransferase
MDAAGTAASKGKASSRLACLDAFRGFDILTMIFVNYIAGMAAIPFIFRHAKAEMDAFTLTDVVFPGFLFIVGVSIPLALAKRKAEGDSTWRLLKHIAVRAAALIFLGVIQVNEESFSAAASGLSRDAWFFLAYMAIIGLWMMTPKDASERRRTAQLGIKAASAVVLAVLLVIFRGQTEAGAVVWLQHSWWGILGIIGWTYLAASLLYLLSRGDRTALLGMTGLAVVFFIATRHGVLMALGLRNGFIDAGANFGSHTAIILAGAFIGTLFLPGNPGNTEGEHPRRIRAMVLFGAGLVLAAYLLRPLHGFSKILATESWALATAGICALLLAGFYVVMDVLKLRRWAGFLQPIGRNPLLAYILPGILDALTNIASSFLKTDIRRVFWPLAERGGLAGMANAALMTAFVLFLTWLATRNKVILKL